MVVKMEILRNRCYGIPSAISAWVLPGIVPSLRAKVQLIKFTLYDYISMQAYIVHLTTIIGIDRSTGTRGTIYGLEFKELR